MIWVDALAGLFRWRARRRCFHGAPSGASFVEPLAHVDQGRRLWECRPQRGGCGRRWVQ